MKSSPQLKTDYPAFENKHALQPIVPSLEPSSQVASDGICARCIKTIDSIFYMKGPAKKTIKKKKKTIYQTLRIAVPSHVFTCVSLETS